MRRALVVACVRRSGLPAARAGPRAPGPQRSRRRRGASRARRPASGCSSTTTSRSGRGTRWCETATARRSAAAPRASGRRLVLPLRGGPRGRRLQRALERDLERRPHRPGGARVRGRTGPGGAGVVAQAGVAEPDDRHDRALALPARRARRGRCGGLPLRGLRPRARELAEPSAGALARLPGDRGAARGGLRALHRRRGAAEPRRERVGDALRARARARGGDRPASGPCSPPSRCGSPRCSRPPRSPRSRCCRCRPSRGTRSIPGSRSTRRSPTCSTSSPPRSGSAAWSRSRRC